MLMPLIAPIVLMVSLSCISELLSSISSEFLHLELPGRRRLLADHNIDRESGKEKDFRFQLMLCRLKWLVRVCIG